MHVRNYFIVPVPVFFFGPHSFGQQDHSIRKNRKNAMLRAVSAHEMKREGELRVTIGATRRTVSGIVRGCFQRKKE